MWWCDDNGMICKKPEQKPTSHHLLYDYTIYYDLYDLIAAPSCCPQLLFPIEAILRPQMSPAAVALWMKWLDARWNCYLNNSPVVLQKVRERKTKVSKGVFLQLCNYCVAVCNRLVTALGAFCVDLHVIWNYWLFCCGCVSPWLGPSPTTVHFTILRHGMFWTKSKPLFKYCLKSQYCDLTAT